MNGVTNKRCVWGWTSREPTADSLQTRSQQSRGGEPAPGGRLRGTLRQERLPQNPLGARGLPDPGHRDPATNHSHTCSPDPDLPGSGSPSMAG